MKKILRHLLVVLLLCSLTGNAMGGTLKLPSKLTIIESQAFYQDSSLDEVVLRGTYHP